MTDIVRREAEFPLCLFMGKHRRGFIVVHHAGVGLADSTAGC